MARQSHDVEEDQAVGWINLELVAERLHLVLDLYGYPKIGRGKQLADEVGRTQGAVSRWLSGKSLPDIKPLLIIAAKFRVSLDWLVLGVGDGPIRASGPFMTASALLAEVAAERGNRPGEPLYGLRMPGPSMAPTIPAGAPLLFRVADRIPLKSNGVYLFETKQHGPMVRRIKLPKGSNVEVTCDNQRYESHSVSRRDLFLGDFRIRGEIVGMISKP